jgi:hypothetical protein
MIQGVLFDELIEDQAQIPDDARLAHAFDDALRALVRKEPRPSIETRFYPYVGLSSTIRVRQGRVYARVSDLLRTAPQEVLYSLACILLAKLYRRKLSREQERPYREHAADPSVVSAAESSRKCRGFKITTSARGTAFDLDKLFDSINARYFDSQLTKPVLSWGQRETRRVLGHHDHVHGAIILSPSLDRDSVPRFVVEYVLYHEMLHIKHKATVVRNRTIYHSRSFRADERRFERFREASKWIEEFADKPKAPRRRLRRGGSKRSGTKQMKGRLST